MLSLFLALQTRSQPLAQPAAGVAADLKYIRCSTCRHLIAALHKHAAERRAAAKKKLGEEDIQKLVEDACVPDSEAGGWLRKIDMVEAGEAIELRPQPQDGPCGTECGTMAMACAALLEEDWDSELTEALYAAGHEADALVELACTKWSKTACRRVPKLDAARAKGPPFTPFTDEERAERQGALPGYFTQERLRHSLDCEDPRAKQEDDARHASAAFVPAAEL